MDPNRIQATRQIGYQNSRSYMAMHDLDVYVATSMREPLHFTSNWGFVNRLFHEGDLKEWNLRYFDPTQSYLGDRIQKGLLECLMIKRAQLTVYNAQEEDTFGKDAEAGVTLAQRKPVIIFVARLFEAELASIYAAIDRGARVEQNVFLDQLVTDGLLSQDERESLLALGKTKRDSINTVIRKHAPATIKALTEEYVAMELLREGYDASRQKDVTPYEFALRQILKLEGRALTFRDAHPLSLQTSPIDGVARGVIVTRSVADTAKVIRSIFLGTMSYEIKDEEENWLLVDTITGSPVRVVSKDPLLTTAFWTEDWSGDNTGLPMLASAKGAGRA